MENIKKWLKKNQNRITTVVGSIVTLCNSAFLYSNIVFADASYGEIFNSLWVYALSGGAFLSSIFGILLIWWNKNIEEE